MTFDSLLEKYDDVITYEIRQFIRQSGVWRFEEEDLRQEILLVFWENRDKLTSAKDTKAYARRAIKNTLQNIERNMRKDVLFHADNYGLCPEDGLRRPEKNA